MPERPDVVRNLIAIVLSEDTVPPGQRTETRSFEKKLAELIVSTEWNFDLTDSPPSGLHNEAYQALLHKDKQDAGDIRVELLRATDGSQSKKIRALDDKACVDLWMDIRFAALFALCTLARLNNNLKEYEEWLNVAREWKWAIARGSYYHLRAMFYSTRHQPLNNDLQTAWADADEACKRVLAHNGFLHNRAEIAAKLAEQIRKDETGDETDKRVGQGLADMQNVTGADGNYAKFWATRARLELIEQKYKDAEESILKALRLECGRWDSHHRRANYMALLQQIRFRNEAESLREEVDNIKQISDKTKKTLKKTSREVQEKTVASEKSIKDYVEGAKVRHIEILGFFITIVAFLAGGMQTIIGAAKPASASAENPAPRTVQVAQQPAPAVTTQDTLQVPAGPTPAVQPLPAGGNLVNGSGSSRVYGAAAQEIYAATTALCMLAGTLLSAFAGLGWLIRSESTKIGMRSLALVCLGAFVFTLGLLARSLSTFPGDSAFSWFLALIGLAAICALSGCILAYLATREAKATRKPDARFHPGSVS